MEPGIGWWVAAVGPAGCGGLVDRGTSARPTAAKSILLLTFILAGVGAGRLAGRTLTLQLPAAALYLWSAYAASRLLMGHWGCCGPTRCSRG